MVWEHGKTDLNLWGTSIIGLAVQCPDGKYFGSIRVPCDAYDRGSIETLQLHPDYIHQGLLVWKEAKLKIKSIESRPKLSKTRVTHPSVKLSKTP